MANQIAKSNITVGWQSGTTGVLYAAWTWKKENTDHYQFDWQYTTGNSVWFDGTRDGTSKGKTATYNVPSNAINIRFRVKPVAADKKSNNTTEPYWTSVYSDWVVFHNGAALKPATPSPPTVVINGYKLTVSLDTYDANTKYVQFRITQNDRSPLPDMVAKVTMHHAEVTVGIEPGNEYKARCRGLGNLENNMVSTCLPEEIGDWSEYSGNNGTIPGSATANKVKVLNPTTAQVHWHRSTSATSYTVEYTTNKGYFDSGPSMVQSVTVPATVLHAEITGLESGQKWYFRVKATNDEGDSGWSDIMEAILGTTPQAPTTWSETTTVIVGNPARLYWIHNCEDGSDQTAAQLEYTINGQTTTEDHTTGSSKRFETSGYAEGATLQWRVRTKGINGKWGDWSTMRTVTLYAPPTISCSIPSSIASYPFLLAATAGPYTQTAVGFDLTITANETYENVDNIGRERVVRAGEVVFHEFYPVSLNSLTINLTPGDVLFENGISYAVKLVVAMNSGLTAEATGDFRVSFAETDYYPNASIGIDTDRLCAYISPFCQDENDDYPSNVTLAVYRREYDGKFVEIMSGIENGASRNIVDPHPSLDYARYRIVSTNTETGEIDFYDCPGIPISDPSIVIQWDEEWTDFDPNGEEAALSEQPWNGSMLKLPYNIDTQDNNSPDVQLVKYIGRENPVSYYGTQIGKTASWKCDIDAEDIETLYQLRRLAAWMGDVYVREPSGTGFWAQINVSFSYTHKEVIIPVTITVNKVEGGV